MVEFDQKHVILGRLLLYFNLKMMKKYLTKPKLNHKGHIFTQTGLDWFFFLAKNMPQKSWIWSNQYMEIEFAICSSKF